MAVEKVREYLKEYHMEDRILEFDVSSATVELAAQAVGCEPERIAKTMSFLVNEEVILIVTAGDVKIDNKKYRPNSGRYFVFVFLSVFSLVFEIVRQKFCAALLQKTALYNRPVVEPHVPRQIVKRAAAARLWV